LTPVDLFWSRCEGPIVYGVNDCCMTVADVIVAAGGPDLMVDHRGRYKTRLGFMRLLRKGGHSALDAAVAAELTRQGVRVSKPHDFDVAMVAYADDGVRQVSPAFYHSGFWCLRSERGMLVSKGSPATIWRVLDA
jgi:hypothetical protein